MLYASYPERIHMDKEVTKNNLKRQGFLQRETTLYTAYPERIYMDKEVTKNSNLKR